MKRRIYLILGLYTTLSGILYSQIITNPNYSLKSHETLNIIRVEVKPDVTVFYLTIENRITGGTFCADRNIYAIYPNGKRSRLESSSGIPVCPDTHRFKTTGEKLEFTLTFPPLKTGTKWIDLLEDCRDNCFSFYGIALNNDLNRRIDDAFALVEKGKPDEALNSFIDIAEEIDVENHGIEGLIYINIIKLSKERGDDAKAEDWYKKFKLSGAPRLTQYIKYLNDQGIKY